MALGSTIMLVTHDMDEAIRLGDNVAVMDDGKLVQHGTPAEIISQPATGFVADMVGDVERPLRLLSLLPVSEVVEDGTAEGEALPVEASLRDALSACLWTGRTAVPIERDGAVVGHQGELRRALCLLLRRDGAQVERVGRTFELVLTYGVEVGLESRPRCVEAQGRLNRWQPLVDGFDLEGEGFRAFALLGVRVRP